MSRKILLHSPYRPDINVLGGVKDKLINNDYEFQSRNSLIKQELTNNQENI